MRWLRKLPIVAAILGFFAAFTWLDHDKDIQSKIYPPYSLHNTSERGASLAFRYLKESRGPQAPAAAELNRTLEFAELPADGVVIRLAPEQKPGEHNDDDDDPNKSGKGKTGKAGKSAKPGVKVVPPKPLSERPLLTAGESKWIEGGGRLVLAISANYGPIETVTSIRNDPFEKTFPLLARHRETDADIRAHAQKAPRSTARTRSSRCTASLFAARLLMGKGELVILAAPEIFNNGNLESADNLKLLAELAPAARPVYFDEWVHGLAGKPDVGEFLVRWGFGMALVVMCLGSVMLFWRARTPVGPPEDDHKETRTQAIDFVGSLAPLYNRALEPHQAIALHYKNFIQQVSAQTGLRGAEVRAKILALLKTEDDTALAGQIPLAKSAFESLLQTLNEAYGRLERAHRR